eukprot:13081805-Alexandrium_andersonii.AAC.1
MCSRRADVGGVDGVPAAGAVGVGGGTDVFRVRAERLVLRFPEEEHRCLENVPAPEPDFKAGRTRELLPRPGPGGHVEGEGHVDEFALRPPKREKSTYGREPERI